MRHKAGDAALSDSTYSDGHLPSVYMSILGSMACTSVFPKLASYTDEVMQP